MLKRSFNLANRYFNVLLGGNIGLPPPSSFSVGCGSLSLPLSLSFSTSLPPSRSLSAICLGAWLGGKGFYLRMSRVCLGLGKKG